MAEQLGGKVVSSNLREFGYAQIRARGHSDLFKDIQDETNDEGHGLLNVWMSHGDQVASLPKGFKSIASTDNTAIAAMADEDRKFYGLQFHPEVTHTTQGIKILERFLHEIFPVPDRRAAAQPAGFLVVGLAPGGPRVGRLLFALEIFPLATLEDEAVGLVRGVAAHGGFPVVAVVVVEVGMNQFDRIAGRVADDRPRETKPVADTVDQLPIRCAQLDAFAVVVEFADPRAKRLAAELGLELIRLMRDDGEAPGRNGAADGEGKLHGVLQRPAAEVDRLFPLSLIHI